MEEMSATRGNYCDQITPPKIRLAAYLEVFAFGSAKLLKVEVEHGSESVDDFRLEKGLLDALCQVIEHLHRFRGQRQVTAALTLVLT